jgi:hypothetical protein
MTDSNPEKKNGRDRHEPTVREVMKAFRKVHLHSGDVILLKKGSNLANEQDIDRMIKAGEEMGLDKVLIVVVDDFDDVKHLNENSMAEYGWFRIETIRKLIHSKPSSEGDS